MVDTPKVDCPILQVHTRLNQAFSMFSEVGSRYQKPDAFTVTLNDLIQALRNVTFILQAEKSKIPDFDKWYPPYQEEMKKNETLQWLVEARNHVVKRGNLEKKSHLTLRVKDHLDQPLLKAVLNPYIPLEEALATFKKAIALKIPKYYEDETIIEAEREWIVESFPKAEITDALIYCFAVLTQVVYDAHVQCGVNPMECSQNTFVEEGKDFMITIRNAVKKCRTLKVLYTQDKKLSYSYKEGSFSPLDKVPGTNETYAETAEKRYSMPDTIKNLKDNLKEELPFSKIPFHIEMSRHMFSVDGRVDPIAFLYFPDRPPIMIPMPLGEPQDRYVVGELLAEKVEETHCTALLTVGEVWLGEQPKPGEELIPPRLQKNKKEQVMILAASPEKTVMHTIDILRRPDGTATLGKEVHKSSAPNDFGFFSRVYRVWEYQQKKS